jgi:hypothetical protein
MELEDDRTKTSAGRTRKRLPENQVLVGSLLTPRNRSQIELELELELVLGSGFT